MSNSTFHFVVIDDDNVNNMVCTAAIKTATDGAALPVCFTNPIEGLKYMENEYLSKVQNKPTILFLYLAMPEMSGWEWLFKFEQLPQTIKQNVIIYVLSG